MSQLQETVVIVVKKTAAPATAFTTSIGFATLVSIIPNLIGGVGTIVGIVITVIIFKKKSAILKQEEALNEQQKEINRLEILSMKDSIKHKAEGGEQCQD